MSDEFVDPGDLQVQRDGDGHVIPKTVEAGTLGKVKVRPMSFGDVQATFGDGTEADLDSAQMAGLFNQHFVKPDFDLSEQDVEDFKPLVPRDLLMALMEASGIDADVMMDETGNAQVDVEGNT